MASELRLQLIIKDTNMGSYTLPADIRPALANINIKTWSYQQCVANNFVENSRSRKDIDIFYRSFIKRLIDYQQTEQQSREAFISNKVSICLDNDLVTLTHYLVYLCLFSIKRTEKENDLMKMLQEVEANYLFEERNERNIISTIDDQTLSDEVMLNIYSTKSSYTSEEIKGSFDLYRSKISKTKRIVTVANIDVLKGSIDGEIQSYSTREAQNEDVNLFQKDRIGRKVDMIGNLKEMSFKVEVLFGEVSGGLGPFGLPAATRKKNNLDDDQRKSVVLYGWTQHGLEINVYALKWEGNGTYLFGLVDKGTLPSCENECGIFEDLYCIFKELE
ncbi:17887_t:CDS:2, partial [Funneliformis caledonium]